MRHSGTLVYMMKYIPMNADALAAALAHEEIGHTVKLHGSVPSTMPLAKSLSDDPAVASGAIVVAEEQTTGRGRLSRRWEAPFGQALLMTVMLKQPALQFLPAQLPMAASLAILDAVVELAPTLADSVAIKWPNDVLIDCRQRSQEAADWRKVAGILVETAYAGSDIAYALIGMGINVNQDKEMLPTVRQGGIGATSIRQQTSDMVDRMSLAIVLCKRLGHWLSIARRANDDTLYTTWRDRLLVGSNIVTIYDNDGQPLVSGVIDDVNPAGQLIVSDETGKRHTFHAGDVSLQL